MGAFLAAVRLLFLTTAVVFVGCTPSDVPPTPTAKPAGTTPPPAVEVETIPCAASNPTTTEFAALASPPPLPVGAGEEEEGELEQGQSAPVPANPDAVVLRLGDLPVVPPPGAHEDRLPEDVTDFGVTSIQLPVDWRSQTSTTAEPSVAVKGDRVLLTWNHVAAVSHDRGQTFQYLYPLSNQPFMTDDGGFCCDQLAHYVPQHDLWLWVLQYSAAGGQNRIRLAASRGDADFDAGQFHYWDFTPQDAGRAAGVTYDQTRWGTSDGHLFLSINMTNAQNRVIGGVLIRIALDDLASYATVRPNCILGKTPEGAALASLAPVSRAASTMYVAAHYDTATLAVWRWSDDQVAPSYHLVRDRSNDGVHWIAYPATSDAQGNQLLYSCPVNGDPATDWCRRPATGGGTANDERIFTGWVANGQVGWAWNARQIDAEGTDNDLPFPWMFALVIDEQRLSDCALGGCVLGYPWLAYKDRAVEYPAIATNSRGDLGGVVLVGGGEHNVSCAAIVRDQYTGRLPTATELSPHSWDVWEAAFSERPPVQKSGDYLGVWPDGGNDLTWSGACMTYVTGSPPTAVHFVRFGRKLNDPGD